MEGKGSEMASHQRAADAHAADSQPHSPTLWCVLFTDISGGEKRSQSTPGLSLKIELTDICLSLILKKKKKKKKRTTLAAVTL